MTLQVRPEGFEPPTLGSEDRCASDVKPSKTKDLRQPPKGEVPTVVPSSLRSDSGPFPAASDDPVLAQITAGWADLPKAVKTGLLALIQAAGGSDA